MPYSKKRRFNSEYIQYGFVRHEKRDGSEQPFCLLCLTRLAAYSMRPCKLRRHLEVAHPKYVNDTMEIFERRAKLYEANTLGSHGFQSLEKKKRQGSYQRFLVSLLIAQTKKSHTDIIKVAAVKSTRLFFGDKAARKIDRIPLSNNTIKRRIDEISIDGASCARAQRLNASHVRTPCRDYSRIGASPNFRQAS